MVLGVMTLRRRVSPAGALHGGQLSELLTLNHRRRRRGSRGGKYKMSAPKSIPKDAQVSRPRRLCTARHCGGASTNAAVTVNEPRGCLYPLACRLTLATDYRSQH